MNLISESYKAQNIALHEKPGYGISGHKRVEYVRTLCDLYQTRDILDYGCGKRTLQEALGFPIQNYDPCIAGFDAEPTPADLVVCNDVLEHIEPDYLDNLLDDIDPVTKRVPYLVAATTPAKKVLPDGRNAHLIQEGFAWWAPKIAARFKVRSFADMKTTLHFICEKL